MHESPSKDESAPVTGPAGNSTLFRTLPSLARKLKGLHAELVATMQQLEVDRVPERPGRSGV
jgi:hypothetical protein